MNKNFKEDRYYNENEEENILQIYFLRTVVRFDIGRYRQSAVCLRGNSGVTTIQEHSS